MEAKEKTGIFVPNQSLSSVQTAENLVSYIQSVIKEEKEALLPGSWIPSKHQVARWFVRHEEELPKNVRFIEFDKSKKHELTRQVVS